MKGCIIRKAAENDALFLADRLTAMIQFMEASGGHPVESADHVRALFQMRLDETLVQDNMLYLVAEVNGHTVGVLEAANLQISWVFQPLELLHIHGVFVDEGYRRRGIARQLIEQAMAWGRERGCTMARLNVLAGNPAQRLYHDMGFTEFQYEMTRQL